MIDWLPDAIGTYMCWWNAGGTMANMHQIVEWWDAKTFAWASSKLSQ